MMVMMYTGEAMTYLEPLWDIENLTAANLVLARLDASGYSRDSLTPRETAYITAVHQ